MGYKNSVNRIAAVHIVRPRTPSTAARSAGAQCIRRASQILRIVASFPGRGASLGEVVAASRLQKATVHRMLRALCDEGMVEQDDLSRNYRVGIGVFALSAAMGDRFDIRAIAHESLEAIRNETEDTVYLAIRSGYDGLCLSMLEGTYPEKTLKLSVHDRWPGSLHARKAAAARERDESEELRAQPDHFLPDDERRRRAGARRASTAHCLALRHRDHLAHAAGAAKAHRRTAVDRVDEDSRNMAWLALRGRASRFMASHRTAARARGEGSRGQHVIQRRSEE